MAGDDLLEQLLSLPRRERVRLAEELLSSLEEPEEQLAAAWVPELERRSQEIAQGAVRVTPWETARAEITAELEERRARRSPS
jgi:putative addiction module component (TIGR02574 family)